MAKTMAAKTLPKEADRKKIPVVVQHQLLIEAGFKCGSPVCRNIITLELHHIQYVSEGGKDIPENLLALCPYCHAMHHAGHIPVEAIRHWKGMLLALNQAFDRCSQDLLLFLWESQGAEIWYTGDTLLRFAALIAAGLVGFKTEKLYGQTPTTSGFMGSIPTVFCGTSYELGMKIELHLTEKGKRLVEAWRAGNEDQYRSLISSPKADSFQHQQGNPS
jgi:hypothetical protein